jgi:Ser/Thr protein kinase RdoA (MazF antagonist)
VTLRSVLAAFGIVCERPYRVNAGRNNEHWYVGKNLVLRRYGSLRSNTAIEYEHTIMRLLGEKGWPVAIARRSGSGGTVVVEDGRRYALFPRLGGRRGTAGRPRYPRELGRLLCRLHCDLAGASVLAPPEAFPRVLEVPGDPAWLRLDDLDDSNLTERIRGSLVEVSAVVGPASGEQIQVVHGDWHDGNLLYQDGSVSGTLDFDFVHPDLALVDVGIATMIPEVADSAEVVLGYFGSRLPTDHELDVIAGAQRARALSHIAYFISRYFDGDNIALDQVRLGADRLLLAEQRWPTLRTAILSGATD